MKFPVERACCSSLAGVLPQGLGTCCTCGPEYSSPIWVYKPLSHLLQVFLTLYLRYLSVTLFLKVFYFHSLMPLSSFPTLFFSTTLDTIGNLCMLLINYLFIGLSHENMRSRDICAPDGLWCPVHFPAHGTCSGNTGGAICQHSLISLFPFVYQGLSLHSGLSQVSTSPWPFSWFYVLRTL